MSRKLGYQPPTDRGRGKSAPPQPMYINIKGESMKLDIRKTEYELLAHLLETHISEGSYFGRKDQHYKMSKELLEKLKSCD